MSSWYAVGWKPPSDFHPYIEPYSQDSEKLIPLLREIGFIYIVEADDPTRMAILYEQGEHLGDFTHVLIGDKTRFLFRNDEGAMKAKLYL